MVDSRRQRDDDRPARRRDDDDAPRGRAREDDAPRRSSRDEEPRRSARDDDRGSRGREDDRGGRSRSRDDDAPRRGSSSGYKYTPRAAEDAKKRSTMGGAGDYDKILKDHIKMWKPNDGDNRIRILPPTWRDAKHFAFDVWVNYGIGPDRGSYISLSKMKDEADPIAEELQRARDSAREGDKEDEKYIKDLTPKRRELIYLVDRDNPKDGVQAWAMPWTLGRDIVRVSIDRETGEVLPIDDPENGYDVDFTKSGQKDRTEYGGVSIARRSSPLGRDEWLDFAIDNPLPDQLNYFDYDHIAKAFGAKGEQREKARGRDDDYDDRRPSRDDDRGRGRDDRGRDREEPRGRGREPEPKAADEVTWESVHDMTSSELDDLIEQEKLKIDPREAKDDEDLADWICEEMGLEKAPAREERAPRRRDADDEPAPRAKADDGHADKLRDLRRRREG